MTIFGLIHPGTGEELLPELVRYDHTNAVLSVDARLTNKAGTSSVRNPEACLEDALYRLAGQILSDDFDAKKDLTSLNDVWQARLETLEWSKEGSLDYTSSELDGPDLSVDDSWDDILKIIVKGGRKLYKPITRTQRTIEQDVDAERLYFRPNLGYGFDHETKRWIFSMLPEIGLYIPESDFQDYTHVECRKEDLEELTELSQTIIKKHLAEKSSALPEMHVGKVDLLNYELVKEGTKLLERKGLRYSDFESAGAATVEVDLGGCGQNEVINTEAMLADRKGKLVEVLLSADFKNNPRSILMNSKQGSALKGLVDQLISERPEYKSFAAWSEVMTRVLKDVKARFDGMMALTLRATQWDLTVQGKVVEEHEDPDLTTIYRSFIGADHDGGMRDDASAKFIRHTIKLNTKRDG